MGRDGGGRARNRLRRRLRHVAAPRMALAGPPDRHGERFGKRTETSRNNLRGEEAHKRGGYGLKTTIRPKRPAPRRRSHRPMRRRRMIISDERHIIRMAAADINVYSPMPRRHPQRWRTREGDFPRAHRARLRGRGAGSATRRETPRRRSGAGDPAKSRPGLPAAPPGRGPCTPEKKRARNLKDVLCGAFGRFGARVSDSW
jgi:hypothetical protein